MFSGYKIVLSRVAYWFEHHLWYTDRKYLLFG